MSRAVIFVTVVASLVLPCARVQADLAADYADAASKLRTIGVALQHYAADHPTNSWPGRLTNLVSEGYLGTTNLLCSADFSDGTQGGVPDAGISVFAQYPEVDESGCSFFYEFTEAECSWAWSSYLGASLATVDLNGDGKASWGEVKQYQLQNGDAFHPGAYDPRIFPSVRCFWFGFGNSNILGSQTMINLAADRTNVFASHLIWELQADVSPDETPTLRDVYQSDPYGPPPPDPEWTLGNMLSFPLWPKAVDTSNMTYRIVEPIGTGQTQILGSIAGNILQWTPNHFSPSNSYVRIELARDGSMVTNKTYCIHIPGTDGDGMPNDWEMENFGALDRDGTLDWDSDLFPDLYEYIAGTCPTNGGDYLRIRSIWPVSNAAAVGLQWESVTGRTYHVLSATNLLQAWTTNGAGGQGTGELMTTTNPVSSSPTYYRLNVRMIKE